MEGGRETLATSQRTCTGFVVSPSFEGGLTSLVTVNSLRS